MQETTYIRNFTSLKSPARQRNARRLSARDRILILPKLLQTLRKLTYIQFKGRISWKLHEELLFYSAFCLKTSR